MVFALVLVVIGLVLIAFHPLIGGAFLLAAAVVGLPFLLLAWFRR